MGYTVHGVLQARILEWVAFPFSRGSSQPRDQAQVFCIASVFFTSWATREAFRVKKFLQTLVSRAFNHSKGAALLHTKSQPRSRSSTNGLHVCIYSTLFSVTYYIYIYSFHYVLLQDVEYSYLCYTVGTCPCCVSILYIAVCRSPHNLVN